MAERTRIAREMHDVLAHRISLLALHAGALEVQPDLPSAKVRETAELLRSTARQALEELRGVIGILREDPGQETMPPAPQPTLSDIPRLVEETRRTGAKIDFEMQVEDTGPLPSVLGRDAYRIVQEALPMSASTPAVPQTQVRVTGAPGHGLHVVVGNREPVHAPSGPSLPGSGAGLLGLQERVDPRRRHPGPRPGRIRQLRRGRRAQVVSLRVLLVDDDALVRAGLRMILSSADDLEIVGEVDDGVRVVAAVREHRPDVVLMDIRMPRDGRHHRNRRLAPPPAPPQVIVLTTFQADEQVVSALRAGASGFLVKDTPPAEIINAVRVVAPAMRSSRRP